MNLPHWNRLTGLRWWRHLRNRDDSVETRQRDDTKIADLLQAPQPCAIGKIGTTELMGLEYLYRRIQLPWPAAASWRRPAQRLHDCSGLFPVRRDIYLRWAEEYRSALNQMDYLAHWQPSDTYLSVMEDLLIRELAPSAFRGSIDFLHFWGRNSPWLDTLAVLRWLVIHPFANTIRLQLPKLPLFGIFSEKSQDLLQHRATDTRLISCPQFSYMVPPTHRDWFHALEEMKSQMESADFDIVLVGAGAWSLPLVAHAKKLGKKGIHLGGALQLLFGIKGSRFDRGVIYNEHWIRPLSEETPANCRLMEEGAYW